MLEKLKGTFDKSVAAVSVKSESLVETSKIKTAISNTQKAISQSVAQLGAKYYTDWCSSQVDLEAMETECLKIQEMYGEIDRMQQKLVQIKEEENRFLSAQKTPDPISPVSAQTAPAGDYVFCTNCGKKLPAGAAFCAECGKPL